MTSRWVLLLTDDPLITATTARLAASAGVPLRCGEGDPAAAVGAGPPGLLLIGADRLTEPLLPPATAGVPRVLVATGEPQERFWRAAMELRAEQVVLLPDAEQTLLDRLTRVLDLADRRALVIGVAGGCGGAGASVLSAALARAATGLARTLLMEVDRMGSGADQLLGAEDEPGLRWPDLATARGRLLPGSVFGAVPVVDGLSVLAWDRSPELVPLPAEAGIAVLDAAIQEFGVVVLDLPRRLDDVAVAAARAADLVLLVVPAEVRAVAASRRVAGGLRQHLADVRLVVRSGGLPAEVVADALEVPLTGVLKPEPGIRPALDRGEPPGLRRRGPLATLCRELLAGELAVRGTDGRRAG